MAGMLCGLARMARLFTSMGGGYRPEIEDWTSAGSPFAGRSVTERLLRCPHSFSTVSSRFEGG